DPGRSLDDARRPLAGHLRRRSARFDCLFEEPSPSAFASYGREVGPDIKRIFREHAVPGKLRLLTLKRKFQQAVAISKWGTLWTILSGIVLLLLRTPLEHWSYDFPQVIGPAVEITNV